MRRGIYSHPREAWCGYRADQPGMIPIEGFGGSDCHCRSHLFATAGEPDFVRFSRHVPEPVERWISAASPNDPPA